MKFEGGKRRVVLVHGFSQNGEVWAEIAGELAELGYEVLAPTLPGHGADATHDGASLWETAGLLAETGGHGVYVGYSFGARVILHLTLAHPEVLEGAIAVGPRTTLGGVERNARLVDDRAVADKIETEGVDAFLEGWMQLGFNARLPAGRGFIERRRKARPEGWSAAMRCMGLGSQELETEELARVETPVLLVAGEHDMPAVHASGRTLAATLPTARHLSVEGVGHAVPFELEPDRFAAIVDGYCRSL